MIKISCIILSKGFTLSKIDLITTNKILVLEGVKNMVKKILLGLLVISLIGCGTVETPALNPTVLPKTLTPSIVPTSTPSPIPTPTLPPQVIGTNYEGVNDLSPFVITRSFQGVHQQEWWDDIPDINIACGKQVCIETTNAHYLMFNHNGKVIDRVVTVEFFQSVVQGINPVTNKSRPIFDTHSQRFFILAYGGKSSDNCTGTNPCHILYFVAISKTDNPKSFSTNDWYFNTSDSSLNNEIEQNDRPSFTSLGIGQDLVINSSMMLRINHSSAYGKIRIGLKNDLINGVEPAWFDFFNFRTPSGEIEILAPQPAIMNGKSERFYLLSSTSTCAIHVWAISGYPLEPKLEVQRVPASGQCSDPPRGVQPGTNSILSSLDAGHNHFVNSPYYYWESITNSMV